MSQTPARPLNSVPYIALGPPLHLRRPNLPAPAPRSSLCWALLVLLAGSLIPAPRCSFAQGSGDQTPACNPGRPTVSTPATLTPAGYLQFENGGLYASGSGEFNTQFSINQVTKLTLNSRIQLLALSSPFAHSTVAATSQNDPGDVSLGLQAILVPGSGNRPTVSASYIRRLYAGAAPDIDIGSFSNGAILLVSSDVAGLHFDINGFVNEQVDGHLRRAQFGQTLSVSHALGKFTVAGEMWHFSQPLIRANAVGNLWALSYQLRKNLVVDVAFDHGLTGTSTQWEGLAGFTYLLPRRLWRAGGKHRAGSPWQRAQRREISATG